MNNTFDTRRFWALLKKTFYENRLVLLGTSVLLLALVIFFYAAANSMKDSSFAQNSSLVFGLFSATIYVNILLGNFSKKSSAASFLTLPSSNFEKWLSVFVIVFCMILPLFLLSLKLIDTVFVERAREIAATKLFYSTFQLNKDLPFIKLNFEESNSHMPFEAFLAAFGVYSGISMIGTLYFNQKSYIKTALLTLALHTIFSFGANALFGLIIGETASTNSINFTFGTIILANEAKFNVNASESITLIIRSFMLVILPMALWLIGYVRLREKEL